MNVAIEALRAKTPGLDPRKFQHPDVTAKGERRAEVTLRVDLLPRPVRMAWPRLEDATHNGTAGCARPAEDAFRTAVDQLIYWLADRYGMPEPDAPLPLGHVLEAPRTPSVDPPYSYR